MVNTKQKGNKAVGAAISYYTSQYYTVSIPLNDSQDYDLIVDIKGVLNKIQVKYTSAKAPSGNYYISLRSISGSSGKEYKTVKDTDCQLMFVMLESGILLEIPISDIVAVSNLTATKEVISKYSVMDEMD